MEGNEVKITCQGATTILLDEMADLQGNLKDLTEENYNKLRASIFEYGFSFPVFYWTDENGTKLILDAHQRRRTLLKMREEGFVIPPLPADPIQAENRTQAKKKLLLLNSQFGRMTQEGFDEFIVDVPMEEIGEMLVLPDVMFENGPAQQFGDKNKEIDINELAKDLNITCPRCGFEFKGDTSKIELTATADLPNEQSQV